MLFGCRILIETNDLVDFLASMLLLSTDTCCICSCENMIRACIISNCFDALEKIEHEIGPTISCAVSSSIRRTTDESLVVPFPFQALPNSFRLLTFQVQVCRICCGRRPCWNQRVPRVMWIFKCDLRTKVPLRFILLGIRNSTAPHRVDESRWEV